MRENNNKKKIMDIVVQFGLIGIAVIYLFVAFKIVLFKNGWAIGEFRQLQLFPFRFIVDLFHGNIDVQLKNILGNCFIFFPLGVLIPVLWKKLSVLKITGIGFCVSFILEIVQFVTGLGMTDVDDLLLNTLGVFLGSIFYHYVSSRTSKIEKVKLITFIALVIFGCCGLLSLRLFAPNVLPAEIVVNNVEVFEEADPHDPDYYAICLEVTEKHLVFEAGSFSQSNSEHIGETQELTEMKLAKDVDYILCERVFEYTANGNIKKQTINYKVAAKEEFNQALVASNHHFSEDIWVNENRECIRIVANLTLNVK